jgi:hypothetical protein
MFIIKSDCVYSIEEVETTTQTAEIHTFNDRLFHIKLSTDKQTILADGIDTAIITAKIYNYLDEPQTTATTVTIHIKGDGVDVDITDTIETVNGELSFDFNTATYGEFTITASVPNYRGGEVVINAE